MSNKKASEDRLKKTYSHPEFLREFFPNIKFERDVEEKSAPLSKEEFIDILKQVTNVSSLSDDKKKKKKTD